MINTPPPPSSSSRRATLLVQILAALGVSSIVACSKAIVSPDNAPDAIKECPDDKGHYGEWPTAEGQPGMHTGINDVCLPKPADGNCSGYTSRCVLSRFRCGLSQGGDKVLDAMPTKNPEVCCYKVHGACAIGRPFIVDGVVRLAEITHGTGWSGPAPTNIVAAIGSVAISEVVRSLHTQTLTNEERLALVEVWSRDALTEHASVASFAQLVLELLALGAPSHLVAGAQLAMGDEIRHAEAAFALASFYAMTPIAPTALDTSGSRASAAPISLADFAARTASESCIAETIASLHLHAAADAGSKSNPALAELLRQTAEEESSHALLGYRIVRWAIERGGEQVRQGVRAVFADAARHVGFGAVPPSHAGGEAIDLRSHGILSRSERQAIAAEALQTVIEPAAIATLSAALSAVEMTC